MNIPTDKGYRGPLKAIVLDWAGTTMDHGCMAPAVVFVEVFRKKGVPITMGEARRPMGAQKRVHLAAITKLPDVAARWRSVHGRDCTDDDVSAMFEDFVPLQLACLADHAELIPGCLGAIDAFRRRGLRIGSTTGYTNAMMDILITEAKRRGYAPDTSVCADDVPFGRPEPWMCLENAKRLLVSPIRAIVKVGDTIPDILEGLNAGMWTIGVAKTGNEMGLTEAELRAADRVDVDRRLNAAYRRMKVAGAHYVVDSIVDVPPILDEIDARCSRGEHP